MIIKGGPLANWGLGKHLTAEANERVDIIGSRDLGATSIAEAIVELDAQQFLMGAKKNLAHLYVSPEGQLTDDQWQAAWSKIEAEYGLEASSYVEIQHTKEGRTHRHRVYSRLDPRTGKAAEFGRNYVRNEKLGHELAVLFGHQIVLGKHSGAIIKEWERLGATEYLDALRSAEARQETAARLDPGAKKRSWREHQQEARTGKKLDGISTAVGIAWQRTDTALAFRAALLDAGLHLARGDRATVVVIDGAGGVHGLARALRRTMPDIETSAIKERLKPLMRVLPSIAQAQEYGRAGGPTVDDPTVAGRGPRQHEAETDRRRSPLDLATEVGRAWSRTATGEEFIAALDAAGLVLARGDRRGLVIVDPEGHVHSLTRLLRKHDPDITVAAVHRRYPGLSDGLPTAQAARDRIIRGQGMDGAGREKREQASDDSTARNAGRMPHPDEVRELRRERWRAAQTQRRTEERAARTEIHDLAEKQLRTRYEVARREQAAHIRAHSNARWAAERDLRKTERDHLAASERSERDLVFRGLRRGPIRTFALALVAYLAKISRNRLKRRQSERWDNAKRSDPAPQRALTFREFLQRLAPIDGTARWLLDRELQRAEYRAAQHDRGSDRHRAPPGHEPDRSSFGRPRGPDRGRQM